MASSVMTVLTDREFAVEVDTALEALWAVEQTFAQRVVWAERAVYRAAGMDPVGVKYDRWDKPKPQGDLEDAIEAAKAQAVEPTSYEGYDAAKALAQYAAARKALDEVLEVEETFNDEYRLARWNRAWLVLNTGGHVHSSRACGTCFPTTVFGWLPQLSGADEAYIVDQAGEAACTVCYPSAPVASLNQPRKAFHQTEVEAQQAREERARAKAEREAKKVAKAITTPAGNPLEVFHWTVPERHERLRDGSIKVTPARDRFQTLETAHAAKAWLTDSQEGWGAPKRAEDIAKVAEALAHKFGTTPQDEIAAAAKRAAKRK